MTSSGTPKRAAIYARHSTDKQATSTADQIARCQAHCLSRDYQISGVFSDEAVSGKVRKRPGLNKLLAAARKGQIDVIVTEDLSRLSPRIGHISDTYDILSFLGISIETLGNGTISQMDIGLRGTMNALYLSDLADKTRRGMKAAAKRGSVPGGRSYGYKAAPRLDENGEPIRGLREIVPEEAAIVRQIFEEYLAGQSLKRIADDLNAQGVPSPGGGLWYSSTLVGTASRGSGILRNQLYRGRIVFNRSEWKSHPESGMRLAVIRSEDEWVTADVPDLAIIPDRLFDDVQQELDRRSSIRRDLKEERRRMGEERKAQEATERQRLLRLRQERTLTNAMLFFSGKLYCGSTGKKMGALRKGLYGCKSESCPHCPRTSDTFFDIAIDALTRLDPAQILAAYDSGDIQARRDAYKASIIKLEEQEVAARKEIAAVLDILGGSPRREEVRTFLSAGEDKIRALHMKRSTAVRELRLLSPTDKTVVKALGVVRAYAARLRVDLLDYQPNKRLRDCINRVTLYPGRVEVDWDLLAVMHLLRIDPQ